MARHAYTRIRPGTGFEQRTPARRVLLIESPAQPAFRLRELAMRAGFNVTSASSGPLLKSAARNSSPDLILLSPVTGPPGPSEIARVIKEDAETRSIPIMHVIDGSRYDELVRFAYPTEAQLADDADDEQIVKTMQMLTVHSARVRLGGRTSSRTRSAPLEGDLDRDTFAEVLQFLFVTSKTGRISVRDGRREGRIFLDAGQVVHAELGEKEGLVAFRELCFACHGYFRFEPNVAPPRKTMSHDGIGLLLESARQKDDDARNQAPTGPVDALVASPREARHVAPVAPPSLALPESAPGSARSLVSTVGVVVLVSAILLVALGVYAWTGG